ncbi:M13 family metallopeptidase [Novipirellula artificiosorum]|uniref:Neutral endopeptidase n=1 Tax=Novipirellula artificiosorum TaxID=2528016 RepID=A0A5C6DH17_9BACT|nr:M13 family metallopeptidase [Novipirellula artificiosorum]TWU35137.1 Neutral endopeptidase [Novipirellula artificiosorum]
MRRFAATPFWILTALIGSFWGSQLACAQDTAASKASGIDRSLFSDQVHPGDNFYEYANQKWLESTPIPADKSDYGIFTILNDTTREQVRELIEEAAAKENQPGSAAQKVGDLYRSVMNTDARNAAGIKPIEGLLNEISAIETKSDVARVLGKLSRSGVYGPMAAYVGVDAKDSDQYTVYLTQSGLTLPDRDYYLDEEARYVELREQLQTFIADLLGNLGAVDAKAVEAIASIEQQIAKAHWSKTENRDPEKTYNAYTTDDLKEKFGQFDWLSYADAAGLNAQTQFVVRQPTYIDALAKLFESTDVAAWKSYLRFHVIDAYASSLTESLEQRSFDFHGTAISGISEQEPLWKRAVNTTSSVLGELVGQVYVERHFKPVAKKRMNELVENLKRAFAKRIDSRDWMSQGTKKQALEKLNLFTTKIGYPDQWKDYSKLSIDPNHLAGNLIASAQFEDQRDLAKLGGPIDRNEWHMTPQTINAYYNPTMNEIVFPAAILQPPFFNLAADDAVNYGAIGAVIGHELSHGFDDKGSKYDGHGNLRSWWTPTDREEFERRAAILSEQYSQYEPVAGNYVNGDLTLGENIGDLGGLSLAYEAYRLSLEGKEAPVIDGLNGDQRFFLGWAQIWRRLYREQELLKRLITDPHSPSEYRVNGIVRNMDAWYDAFDIKPNDPLFLAPKQRVRIW